MPKNSSLNIYKFLKVLEKHLPDDAVVISDAGSASAAVSHGLNLKAGQRYITSGCFGSMGFGLPAAIGCAFSGRPVVCITGDGSLQMNIQELAVIKVHNLPIKIFVLNNGGYFTIYNTQRRYFKRYIGESEKSGLWFPSLLHIANTYGIRYIFIDKNHDFYSDAINSIEPIIIEVMIKRQRLRGAY